jgi:2-keto-3-deoxy-6-phosphogluconate aldolase
MIIALSRFGTFTGLYNTFSSNTDLDPSTPTFTFVHSTYTSKYLNFFPVEFASNIHSNNAVGYTLLTTPTKAQLALVTKYDTTKYFPATEGGSIPFVTINNRFMLAGSSYSPSALAGSSHQQIAAALSDSTNPLAQGILTAANLLTASMCVATKDLPANVCVTPAIKAANAVLGIKSSS